MAYYFSLLSLEILFYAFLFLIAYYAYFKLYTSRYWKNKNVFHLEPVFIVGNIWKTGIKENLWNIAYNVYKTWKHKKLVGVWAFSTPVLFVTDLDLMKTIMVRDFKYFHDHGAPIDFEKDPLAGHLFNLSGSKWRNLRVKLTPTFTSGKMKFMFSTMVKCGLQLQDFMKEAVKTENSIEVKELLSRFTTDFISLCAFGIETNSLKNPNSEFRKYGKKFFERTFLSKLTTATFNFFPKFFYLIGLRVISRDISNFFLNAVRETMDYREKNKVERKDFMQLLIQLKNYGKLDDVDEISKEEKSQISVENTDKKFTFNEAAAQAFVFFIAGFETSATALTFGLYELMCNPDVQKTLQKEIDEILMKHDQNFTYDGLLEMHYLDWVVQEILRKHPPVPAIVRTCSQEYTFPELGVTIDKGTRIFFSVYGIQRDPEYYSNPEKFDPKRHSPEEKAKREHSPAFYFGDGPRYCIGNRFGILQIKIALVSLLSLYDVVASSKTPKSLKYRIGGFSLAVEGGMHLAFKPRQ